MSKGRIPNGVCVTGVGLVSPLGRSPDDRLACLSDPACPPGLVDRETYAPFPVVPVRDFDPSEQIPKPGDQRAMGPMMLYGVHAAGLALEQAGIKGDDALLEATHMVVAAGGGERDWALDEEILTELTKVNDKGAFGHYIDIVADELDKEGRPVFRSSGRRVTSQWRNAVR